MKLQKSASYFICLPRKVIKLLRLNRDDHISAVLTKREGVMGLETVIERKYRTDGIPRTTCRITLNPKDIKKLGLKKGDDIDYCLLHMDTNGPGILRFTPATPIHDDYSLRLPDCLQGVDLSTMDTMETDLDDELFRPFVEKYINGAE